MIPKHGFQSSLDDGGKAPSFRGDLTVGGIEIERFRIDKGSLPIIPSFKDSIFQIYRKTYALNDRIMSFCYVFSYYYTNYGLYLISYEKIPIFLPKLLQWNQKQVLARCSGASENPSLRTRNIASPVKSGMLGLRVVLRTPSLSCKFLRRRVAPTDHSYSLARDRWSSVASRRHKALSYPICSLSSLVLPTRAPRSSCPIHRVGGGIWGKKKKKEFDDACNWTDTRR